MLLTKNIKLDFTNKEITTIGLNRYDKDSREYIITFTDSNGVVAIDNTVNTAYIMFRKPDNTNVLLNGTINNDGTVTVLFDEQMTAVDGVGYLQIKFLNNDTNESINTVLLRVVIGASAYDENEVMSSDEFKALVEFLDDAEDLIDEIEENVRKAELAAVKSESWAVGGTDTREGEDTNNSMYYSQQSSNYADNSEASAVRSESWAVGGTNTRTGEDTNNSLYYSGVSSNYATNSQSWAIGGTNTRTGEDTNNSQYFSGVSSDYATNSQSWAIGGTNTRTGEDTNNAKYYSEQSSDYADTSSDYATNSQSWAVGGTSTRVDEDTNNAQYWNTQSSANATLSQSWAVGGTNTRTGEDTDNAQYYATMSQTYSEMALDMMADEYDDTKTYAVGDYVIYNDQLYKCTTAVTTAETFDPTKWQATVLADSAVQAKYYATMAETYATQSLNYSQLAINMVANAYDDTATYEVGDFVIYNNQLYKCTIDVTTAETFDPTKWSAEKVVNIATGVTIDDTTTSTTSTYSSSKIEQRISTAAGATIDDTTVRTTTTYSSSKIESVVAGLIDDTVSDTDTTYSSDKIENLISASSGAVIDDTTATLTSTYSSSKIENLVGDIIDDTSSANDTTYSSNKIESLIEGNDIAYSVAASLWVANSDTSTSTDYPYVANISSSEYTVTSKPIWQLSGVGTVTTSTETSEIAKVAVAYFDTNGITLYATDQPSVDLVLNVKGV